MMGWTKNLALDVLKSDNGSKIYHEDIARKYSEMDQRKNLKWKKISQTNDTKKKKEGPETFLDNKIFKKYLKQRKRRSKSKKLKFKKKTNKFIF